MRVEHKFQLKVGSGLFVDVRPIYNSDLSLDYEPESGQRFFRKKLSGKLTFIGADYTLIMNAPFETEFLIGIYATFDGGESGDVLFNGKFMKTDCQIDMDNKSLTVQPNVLDDYENVLAGLEKEYDLIPLAPELTPLTMDKRPLIQIYNLGDSVISCFLGGTWFEQDCEPVTNAADLTGKYSFALNSSANVQRANVTMNGTPNGGGQYTGNVVTNQYAVVATFTRDSGGGFVLKYTVYLTPQPDGMYASEMTLSQNNTILFRRTTYDPYPPQLNVTYTMTAVAGSGATGTAIGSIVGATSTYEIYVRYLLDVETFRGSPTNVLPADDITPNSRNYRRVVPLIGVDIRVITDSTVNPTQWGRTNDGNYWQQPYSIFGQRFFPIARSTWIYQSMWFGFDPFDFIFEEQGRKAYILRDSFKLSSVINVLLQQIAPEISHQATAECSQFLYGSNAPLSLTRFTLLISQKTNVLKGNYDQPAQRAVTTLQQILNMLRDCFRCYWYIENKKLKIEHVEWFRRGGTYTGSPIYAADLTAIRNSRNDKPMSFATNKYEFDKVDMAERYQFSWMDDVTEPFMGYPINILSKYVTRGKIENVNVGNFTTDIDFMLLNPENIADDGFALFAAITDGAGGYKLPYFNMWSKGVDLYLQNGLMCWMVLHNYYYIYDLPSSNVEINEELTPVAGILKGKSQVVYLPAEIDINPMRLIRTELGSGQVHKISINLSSRMHQITLKYDTN